MTQLAWSAAVVFLLAGCAESLPPGTHQKTSQVNTTSHQFPVLVSVNEVDTSQLSNVIQIDSDTVVVLTDPNNEFDSSAAKVNNSVSVRSRGGVGARANVDATSHIVERTYYRAGVVVSYTKYEYNAAGARTKRVHFMDPGVDGAWFTADDVIKEYSLFDAQQNSVHAQIINYSAAGLDAKWFTADDEIRYYIAYIIGSSGSIVATGRYKNPGVDGLWFTADDIIRLATVENILPDGSGEWIQYRSAGADSDWSTLGDNVIGHSALTTLNATGQKQRHVFYINAGLDALRYTSDDVVGYYHQYAYNSQSLLNQSVTHGGGPGVDLVWFTADDPSLECDAKEYNTNNALSKSTDTDPGVDMVCFTDDDIIMHYHDFAYDSAGNLSQSNAYSGSGSDTTWFTADDEKTRTSKFEPN